MTINTWQKLINQPLGSSDWLNIDQQRINLFADATLDRQFIHVDPEAAALTPFGGTIAHGLLTLSLVPQFLYPLLEPYQTDNCTFINYGTDKLRFIQPVPCDADIRCHVVVSGCEERDPNTYLLRLAVTIEIRGSDKPALVADSLMLIIETPNS